MRPSGPTAACLWRSCSCPRCCPTRTRWPPPLPRTTATTRYGTSPTSRRWAVLRSWPWTWHWRTWISQRWNQCPKCHLWRKSPRHLPFDDMATPSPQSTIVTGWRSLSQSNCQWITKKKLQFFFSLFFWLHFSPLSDCFFSSVATPSSPTSLTPPHINTMFITLCTLKISSETGECSSECVMCACVCVCGRERETNNYINIIQKSIWTLIIKIT